MEKFKCHKIVEAAKIERMHHEDGPITHLHFKGGTSFDVPAEWFLKHKPIVGGYFVRYDDEYESFSPAAAFEAGYTPLDFYGDEDISQPCCGEYSTCGMPCLPRKRWNEAADIKRKTGAASATYEEPQGISDEAFAAGTGGGTVVPVGTPPDVERALRGRIAELEQRLADVRTALGGVGHVVSVPPPSKSMHPAACSVWELWGNCDCGLLDMMRRPRSIKSDVMRQAVERVADQMAEPDASEKIAAARERERPESKNLATDAAAAWPNSPTGD